ncbi:MAG: aldose 1-epimerase [Solirubrobacteraceae bacterium]|jgi:aldose 1-epimerase|nr:aldose 1-epimerase [Solirubrobacteraceae bacterium]
MAVHPSGDQFEITDGDQRATIVEVGGAVREYEVGGRPVLDPFPVGAMCDGAHGTPLIPWPNRLADGRYRWDGADYRVDLTEPAKHNAIHGFLRWRPWRALERAADRVVMGARLYPLSGYPFGVEVSVAYALGPGGLEVTTTATNIGDRACPFGSGHHPYLSPGSGLVDDCRLEVPAATRITTDEERQLPVGREAVEGTPYDFRVARRVGDQQIDFAFTDLSRAEDGLAVTRLTGPDGRSAELWVDEHHPIFEIFTGDTLRPDRRRQGLGVEPMTCPPNAFQTGEGVVRLEPGQTVTTRWGVRLA